MKALLIYFNLISCIVFTGTKVEASAFIQNPSIQNKDSISDSTKTNTVRGKITYLGTPIEAVNISVRGTTKGTKTDRQGNYTIEVEVGKILDFTHVSLKTVSILVEDVTSMLNIEMIDKNTKLDEVVVNARLTQTKVAEIAKKMNVTLTTPYGTFNPAKSGLIIKYVEGKNLGSASPNLAGALGGKFAGLRSVGELTPELLIRDRPVKWIVDNVEGSYTGNLSDIEDVYIIMSKAMIVVRTKNNTDVIAEQKKQITEKNLNQNFYQKDALLPKPTSAEKFTSTTKQNNKNKKVSGQITYLGAPISGVNVSIRDTKRGTETNNNGEYSIDVEVGKILDFSHVSLKKVSVLIEDVTSILNIEMAAAVNELDEVVVISKSQDGNIIKRSIKANQTFSTAMGEFNPRASGYRTDYVDGADIRPGYSSLAEALDGTLPGVRYDAITKKLVVKPRSSMNTPAYAIWDVDGAIFRDEPSLDLNTIESVRILKSTGQTNRYGSIGAGGVVLVTTKAGNYNSLNGERAAVASQHQNQKLYFNDAMIGTGLLASENTFTKELTELGDSQTAFKVYKETIQYKEPNFSRHIGIAKMFISEYNDPEAAKEILSFIETSHPENPEILKAVAYHYQAFGMKKSAIKTYQTIFYLRPEYNQSYRDVANAYVENEQFKRGWRVYMNYLLEGRDVTGEGIGSIVYNEMEYLFYNRKNQTDIKENFVPKFKNQEEFSNDIRLIFEWNTSEAEFELEFVNPELRSYVFEHSLDKDPDLIMEEKMHGYSSKEYILDEIGNGEWLVNLTYLGNKQEIPTYMKLTTYYHWGQYNQRSNIAVYELKVEDKKIQLLKLNRDNLLASN